MFKSFYLSILIVFPFILNAQTFVDLSATGANDGSSWNDAYTNLNMAIDSSASGQVIWVSEGTYIPDRHPRDITGGPSLTNKDFTFHLVDGVKIYGGFDGTETLLNQRDVEANPTILSGMIDSVNFIYASHVLLSIKDSSHTVVDGFIIHKGAIISATASSIIVEGETVSRLNGAGMYNLMSNPSLNKLIFNENVNINMEGGGMYNNDAAPKISNSQFINNGAVKGSAIYNVNGSNPTLLHVDFKSNQGYQGMGMYNDNSSPDLISCVFEANEKGSFPNSSTISVEGGGMYNTNGSAPSLNQVRFHLNGANGNGGGMYNNGSSPVLINVKFDLNFAANGGGMYNNNSSPTLNYVSFSRNLSSNGEGGGMYNLNSSPLLSHCNIGSNIADKGAGIYNNASSPIIQSGVLSSNYASNLGGGMFNANSSTPTINTVKFVGNKVLYTQYGGYTKNGGGLYNDDSSPILTNVLFMNNEAGNGGGMHNNNSSPNLTNVEFKSNKVVYRGGGMNNDSTSSPSLTDVNFINNQTQHSEYPLVWNEEYREKFNRGGGMHNDNGSSPTLFNVDFENNESNYGGGMSIANGSSPILERVNFINNEARQGGGIYNEDSSPSISNVAFSHNRARGFTNNKFLTGGIVFEPEYFRHKGGGMYTEGPNSITLTNVVFSANIAEEDSFFNETNVGPHQEFYLPGRGGGFYNNNQGGTASNITIINATFYENIVENINSNIEGLDIYNECPFAIDLHNSILLKGIYGGEPIAGNLNQTSASGSNNILSLYLHPLSPEFTNVSFPVGRDLKWGTADDGLRPAFGSSIINAGNNSFNTSLKEISGQDRIINDTIDIGAYEYTICNDSTFYVGGNWSNGLPTSSKIAVFQDDYNMTDSGNSSIMACACRIEAGKTLTVGDGTALHVYYNGINIIGTVIIEEGGNVINGIYN